MIVCSCNIITRREIEAVIEEILAEDPYAVLTPGLLYHRLGRRGKCCGCFPHVSRILVEHGSRVRERMERDEWSAEDTGAEPEEAGRRRPDCESVRTGRPRPPKSFSVPARQDR